MVYYGNKSIDDCVSNLHGIFDDFRADVRDTIEILEKDNVYVPFHISDKLYCLKYSEKVTNGVEKECEVVEAEVVKISIEITEEKTTKILRLRATKQPERVMTCFFEQYGNFLFKDETKAKSKCREINRNLRTRNHSEEEV